MAQHHVAWWCDNVRSYILQPYQMVKDLRTGVETSDIHGVLDGDLDAFLGAAIRLGPPTRSSLVTEEFTAD